MGTFDNKSEGAKPESPDKQNAGGNAKGKSGLKVFILFLAVAAIAAAFIYLKGSSAADTKAAPLPSPAPTVKAEAKYPGYEPKSGLETVLVVGVDKFEAQRETDGYNNDQQSDFLMLFIFDDDAETVQAIPIDRNTVTDVMVLGVRGEKVGYEKMQIALSHTYGTGENDSRRNTVDAASRLLNGIKIDHYIFLTMDAIPIVNDLCGGVTVKLNDDFTYINSAMTEGSEYTLHGDEALAYLRARFLLDNDANTARMARQNEYLRTLYEKLVSIPEDDDKGFILQLTAAISDYMESDCSVTQLDSLFDRGQSYDNLGILNIEGTVSHEGEFTEFYADTESLRELVKNVFYEKVK